MWGGLGGEATAASPRRLYVQFPSQYARNHSPRQAQSNEDAKPGQQGETAKLSRDLATYTGSHKPHRRIDGLKVTRRQLGDLGEAE